MKSVFGIVFGLLPIAWFGGLAVYFYRTNQAMGGFATKELGPTIIGLSVVAGLFAIPVLFKILKLLAGGRAKPVVKAGATDDVEEVSDFDPDAALARYLARKEANGGEIPSFQTQPMAQPAARGGFGRKAV
ncbi:MAG: hypothetical protein V4808_08760 [Pseudomonadota bacterium]